MRIVGIIPARYASSRLPGKPLINISGKTLLKRVIEGSQSSLLLDEIIVATDDKRIYDEALNCDAKAVMTDSELPSGSDRIFQAASLLEQRPDIIVNIQGDEVFINGIIIDELIDKFKNSVAAAGTLVRKIDIYDELFDPSIVKVSIKRNGIANYFSRNTIPFLRDFDKNVWLDNHKFFKHIGLYAFKYNTLQKFVNLKPSINEMSEKLEQLRLLDNGFDIYCHEIDVNLLGIDTREDVKKAEKIIQGRISL